MSKSKKPIKLGDKARDNITGFEGVVIARTQWLHGCDRLTIQPDRLDKDGKTIDACSFDEQQVELIEDRPVKVSAQASARPGGPRRDPSRGR